MKFVLAIEKKNRNTIGTIESHNLRKHPTKSQLPESAWITREGHHSIIAFNQELLNEAKSLSKRKDAVLAVELVLGIGNQTDWRSIPTADNPYGAKLPGSAARLNALVQGVKEAALAEFGKERIISIDLHTDESTPHVHVVFAPINNGKLQAKKWLDGGESCAGLRARLHEIVSKHSPCDYIKGAEGGAPHDPEKAAGGPGGPKPKPPRNMLTVLSEAFGVNKEFQQMKAKFLSMSAQLQKAFSRAKRAEINAAKEKELRLKAEADANTAQGIADSKRQTIEYLKVLLEEAKKPKAGVAPGLAAEPVVKQATQLPTAQIKRAPGPS